MRNSRIGTTTGLVFALVIAACVASYGGSCGACTGAGAIPGASPTVIPNPSSSILPMSNYINIAGEKTQPSPYAPQDSWWMGAVSYYSALRPSATDNANFRLKNASAWYGPFFSLRMYDESCPANEGGTCRQQFFDQREQDFIHVGDPAMFTGLPSVGSQSASTGCTWNWVNDPLAVGGYLLYNGADPSASATPIATVGSGVTTYDEMGLTNGTLYFRYIDKIIVSDTTNSAVSSGLQSVTMTSIDQSIVAHTRLHFAGTGAEDVEVVPNPAPTISAGVTVFSATFANAHATGVAVTSEEAYSGLDELDWTTTGLIHTTGSSNGLSLGTRLPANLIGDPVHASPAPVLANCEPLVTAPSTPILANPVMFQQPTPFPTGSAPSPALSALITYSGSVEEVASTQVAPVLSVLDNSDGAHSLPVPIAATWTQSSCGVGCSVWTLPAGVTTNYNGNGSNGNYGPIDEQYCVGLSAQVCTDWYNYAKDNRTANPSYGENDNATMTSCSYQMAIDHEDELNDLVTLVLGNPSPAPNVISTEEIAKESTVKQFDIHSTHDTYMLTGPQLAACSQAKYGPIIQAWANAALNAKPGSIAPPIFNSAWTLAWNDGYFVNFGSEPAGNMLYCGSTEIGISNPCDYNNSPASQARVIDSGFHECKMFPVADEWEGIVTTILEDANRSPAILEFAADCDALADVYWSRANELLTEQWVNGVQTVMDVNLPYIGGTTHVLPIYAEQYAPIGQPLIPLIPFLIPTGSSLPDPLTCIPSCVSAAYQASGFFNSSDNMFERFYSNGAVLVCPHSLPVHLSCNTHSFRDGSGNLVTVWLLNPDANYLNSGLASPRVFTPITSWPGAQDTAAIVEYDPF
jgi:hypothetical protein